MAKVTPYDSKVADGEETPLHTLLVTPALDFKNSTSKMFTFRVRGDYLQDGQADKLELCYIDMLDGETALFKDSSFYKGHVLNSL